MRGDFKFGKNQFPVQNYYLQVIGKGPDGRIVHKTFGTVLTNRGDASVDQCKMKQESGNQFAGSSPGTEPELFSWRGLRMSLSLGLRPRTAVLDQAWMIRVSPGFITVT